MNTPTKQEMYDKSVVGLAKQNFEKSGVEILCPLGEKLGYHCLYQGPEGRRCAWGHVDLSLTTEPNTVITLADMKIGLAGQLSEEDLSFAQKLQNAHDDATSPSDMQFRLRALATEYALTVPQELK